MKKQGWVFDEVELALTDASASLEAGPNGCRMTPAKKSRGGQGE
jgi:hypothetical protein